MLKRFILWDFPRGSWQFDLVVFIILLFIFATPRAWFRDQPRISKASDIAMLPSENGVSAFFVESNRIGGIPKEQREHRVTELLRIRTGNNRLNVTRVEPVRDSEGDLQGYMAFARP